MNKIMVSILVPTYGHEKYISQALNGILKQKTQYTYEVIIGEDSSPDQTRKILHQFENEYPGVFTIIYRATNIGSLANTLDLIRRAVGKYVVILEGDDYWISEDKLEKQVSFLEKHPKHVAVAHNCIVVDENSAPVDEIYPECKNAEYTLKHFRRGILPGQTTTVLCKADALRQIADDKIWGFNPLVGDRILVLGLATKGSIYCIQEKMSAYRHVLHGGTSYSANVKFDFMKEILWWQSMIDFSRRTGVRQAVLAVEGRYFAILVFDGLFKKRITLLQTCKLYQYLNYKLIVPILKTWDFIVRKINYKKGTSYDFGNLRFGRCRKRSEGDCGRTSPME